METETDKQYDRQNTVNTRDEQPSLWKVMVSIGVFAAVMLVVYLSPLRSHLERFKDVSNYVRSFGALAPLVATLGVAFLVVAGLPRLLCCFIAGMTFGFWQGLLWAQLGTLLGNYGIFLTVRTSGREWGLRYLSKHGGLQIIRKEGLAAVIMARQLPLPCLLTNLAFGLSPIRHRHYLLGTILGQLPLAIPSTLIGAGLLQSSPSNMAGIVGLAVVLLVLIWLGFRYFWRQYKGNGI